MGHFSEMDIEIKEQRQDGYEDWLADFRGDDEDEDEDEATEELENVSLQEASYRLWLAENEMESGYGSIGDMAWDEPEAARLLREEQRVRLQAMSADQYNEWLDQQTEEYISRFDATDGRGC